jgi:hypothetical protein
MAISERFATSSLWIFFMGWANRGLHTPNGPDSARERRKTLIVRKLLRRNKFCCSVSASALAQ